jgi:hypothetical protein
MSEKELEARFGCRVKDLSVESVKALGEVALAYREMAKTLLRYTHVSREQSLALTKLEESMLWSTEAIIRER